jgi:hypothetical protein
MRISPSLSNATRYFLFQETRNTHKPINFLIHPNELITEESLHQSVEKRSSNYLAYLLSDVLRHNLKQHNLGEKAAALFEKEIQFWDKKNYRFISLKNYSTQIED